MNQVTINFAIDEKLKEQCEQVLEQCGLDWKTATTTFFKECIRLRKLPFEVTPELLDEAELSPIELISKQLIAADSVREISDSSSTTYWNITDEEMDYRFAEITKLAIKEMKLRGTPIACFDSVLRKAYLEYPDGTREYKDC